MSIFKRPRHRKSGSARKLGAAALSLMIVGGGVVGTAASASAATPDFTVIPFADAALEACVASAVGLNPGDEITVFRLGQLENLRCVSQGIVDISPLVYATSLKTLDLGYNSLSSESAIALSGLTNLVGLNLSNNELDSAGPLSALVSLTELDLSGNHVAEITPLASLVNLEGLDLNGNGVSDVSGLATLTALRQLSVSNSADSGGSISTIAPLAGLVNLKTLALDINGISDLRPVASMHDLRQLSVMFNDLTDLSPVAGLTGLTDLQAGYNRISDPNPVSNLVSLARLGLQSNGLAEIGALAPLVQLRDLDISYNSITSLAPVAGATGMLQLNAFHNQVSELAPLAGMTEAVHVNVGSNLVSQLSSLSPMAKLVNLDASDNAITSLAPVAGIASLAVLDATEQRSTLTPAFVGVAFALPTVVALDGSSAVLSAPVGFGEVSAGAVTWSSEGTFPLSWSVTDLRGGFSGSFEQAVIGAPAVPVPDRTIAITPDEGPTAGGESVMVAGQGFDACSVILVDGVPQATALIPAATGAAAQLRYTTPAHAAGEALVTVHQTCGIGVDSLPDAYTYVEPVLAAPPATDAPSVIQVDGGVTSTPQLLRATPFEAQTGAEETAPNLPIGFGLISIVVGLMALGAAAFRRRTEVRN